MSVRMALAKLCACACGGAIVGGGAVHVADQVETRRVVAQVKKQTVQRSYRRPVRRMIWRTVTTTRAAQGTQVVIVTPQGAPIPLPPPSYGGSGGEMPIVSSSGSSSSSGG